MQQLILGKNKLLLLLVVFVVALLLHITFYWQARADLKDTSAQLNRKVLIIQTLDILQFRDSVDVSINMNLDGYCSLIENSTRLRNVGQFEKLGNRDMVEHLCLNLLGLQTLRGAGLLDGFYIAYEFVDRPNNEHLLMSSSSFPINFGNKEKYSEFLLKDPDFYFHNQGIVRKLYVKNSMLPEFAPGPKFNPFYLSATPVEDDTYISDYLDQLSQRKLTYSVITVSVYLLPILLLIVALWRVQANALSQRYWRRAALQHVRASGFATFAFDQDHVNLGYCSDFDAHEAKLTCYTERGIVCEPYAEDLRFIKVTQQRHEAVYRLLGAQKGQNAEFRVGVRDEKLFDLIQFYEGNYTRDSLTGLHNRTALNNVVKQYSNSDSLFLMALIDLDHFKRLNDTYGHEFGDTVLVHTANYLKSNFKHNKDDLLLRVGGEEFLVMVKVTDEHEDVTALAQILETRLLGFNQQAISLSGGISLWRCQDESFDTAFKRADELLYQSKEHGRKQLTIEAGLNQAATEA